MLHVLTDEQVVKYFGDPRRYILADGRVSIAWEKKILHRFPMPKALPLSGHPTAMVRTVSCHWRVAPFLQAALLEIYKVPGLWATIDDWGGCYAWRLQRNAKKRSRHCWGLGPDMDVKDNPMGDPPGGPDPDLDPRIPPIMERHGFACGVNFGGGRVDQMHSEFADVRLLS